MFLLALKSLPVLSVTGDHSLSASSFRVVSGLMTKSAGPLPPPVTMAWSVQTSVKMILLAAVVLTAQYPYSEESVPSSA